LPIFQSAVTAAGWVDFGEQQPRYMLIKITQIGHYIRQPDPGSVDRFYSAGWVAFGFWRDNANGTFDRFWDAPIHIDYLTMRWHPTPAVVNGLSQAIFANTFRWSLSPGTNADILID